MAVITDLPFEVINIILYNKNISSKDIMSLALTCKHFYNLTNDNVLWHKKIYQRWPSEKRKRYKLININFLKELKRITFEKQFWHYIKDGPWT